MLEFVAKDGTAYGYARQIGDATVYLKLFSGDSGLADALAFRPSVKNLRLEIWSNFLEDADELDPSLSDIMCSTWTENDFENSRPTGSLLLLQSLLHIRITAFATKQDRHYLRNLALLELLLQRAASRSRSNLMPAGTLRNAKRPGGQVTANTDVPLLKRPSCILKRSDVPIRTADIPDEGELCGAMSNDRHEALHN